MNGTQEATLGQERKFAPALRRFLIDLRDALAGKSRDYTSGSFSRAIFLLAVPMVLEMVLESVFAVTDVYFVGKLGKDAITTVGLTESMLTLVFALSIGLSMATTAMVARRIGEKRYNAARTAAVQALFLGILISIPIAVIGIVFAPELLTLMGASPSVIESGANYTRVMIGGNAVIILLFLVNAVFRGAGDAAIAMRVLWLANGINIVLDPCFIFGLGPFPEMGVTGAAVATTIGRGTGVVFQLVILLRGSRVIRIKPRNCKLRPAVMARLLRVSAWGILQWLIATSSWLVLVRIVSVFGSAAVAGYTIGIRIIIFTILPSWGLSNAAATLVGQNLGAGKPDRAQRSVWITCAYNTAFLGLVGLSFMFFSEHMVAVFTSDPLILKHGSDCLTYISFGYFFFACGMVMTQAFNGSGDTFTPTALNFFCFWLLQGPLAYLLAISLEMGPRGVFVAIVVADTVLALAAMVIFRQGRWKHQVI